MSKYIIELDDRIKLVTSVGVTENGVVYTTSDYVHNLEELNSDYINENFGSLQDEAYQAGLDKAWEIARRIRLNYEDGGIDGDGLRKMFGTANTYTIIKDNTASEAVAKIKAYDNVTPSDRIEVGDEEPCIINEQTRQALNSAISALAEAMDRIREKLEVFND